MNELVLRLAVLWLAGGLCSCAAQAHVPPKVQGAWLSYQMNTSHNAVLDGSGPHAWHFDAGSQINGGLAIVDGTLYADTFRAQVLALDAARGTVKWSASTDNITMSTPIVDRNIVYVGTGRNGASNTSRRFAYMSTSSGYTLQPWARTEGDHIIAFQANDGKTMWRYRTIGEDMPSPTIAGNMLVFGNGDFHAYGLDAIHGTARWRVDVGGIVTMASATAIGHDVLISTCGENDRRDATLLLDARTGKILWRSPFGNCDASPTVGGGRVFVSGVDATRAPFGFGGRAIVAALSPGTGKPDWVHIERVARPYTSVGSSERAITGTFANNTYFQALPSYDQLVAFNATSGAIRWRAATVAPIKMSPVVLGRCVFAGDTSGLYYAFDSISGTLIRTRMFDAPFATSPPVIVGRTTYVANGTKIYAFPTRSLFADSQDRRCAR
jgi:outer membrane protein assembly factor BamB